MIYPPVTYKSLVLIGFIVCLSANLSSPAPSSKTNSNDYYNSQFEGRENQQNEKNLEDEDVVALDNLKSSHEHKSNNNRYGEVLPALEKQLILNGQPEEEEQTFTHDDEQHQQQQQQQHSLHDKEHDNSRAEVEGNNPSFKSFHGAARLTFGQNPDSVSTSITTTSIPITPQIDDVDNTTPDSTNTNAGKEKRSEDIKKPKNAEYLLQHSGGQYSSLDVAQYVFWTGDEEGVARAVEEYIQKGLMSRETAIKFLRDISMGIEYLENTYSNRVQVLPNGGHSLVPTEATTTSPPPTTPKIIPTKPTISAASASIRKPLQSIPSLVKLNQMANEQRKENLVDYDEINGRLRLADFLYAEYSLEEVIYQLAKVMFSQSLTRGSEQAQTALQRLTAFLESEGTNGRISPALQKKVLDVLLAALSDTLNEHPEVLAAAQAEIGQINQQLNEIQTKQTPVKQSIK